MEKGFFCVLDTKYSIVNYGLVCIFLEQERRALWNKQQTTKNVVGTQRDGANQQVPNEATRIAYVGNLLWVYLL